VGSIQGWEDLDRGGFGLYDQPVVATFFGNPFENSPPFYLSVNAAI